MLWELMRQSTHLFTERFMLAQSLPTTTECSVDTWIVSLNSVVIATLVAIDKLTSTDTLRKLTIPKSL